MQCPRITLPEYVYITYTTYPSVLADHLQSGTPLEMEKGHISLMPFYVAEQLVARGEAELV
jgi:hypothetical protein